MNSKQWITAPTCSNQFVSMNMSCIYGYLSELLKTSKYILTYNTGLYHHNELKSSQKAWNYF